MERPASEKHLFLWSVIYIESHKLALYAGCLLNVMMNVIVLSVVLAECRSAIERCD